MNSLIPVCRVRRRPDLPVSGRAGCDTRGGETVASLVQFIDGLPFKPGYKRYKIRTVDGVDDFASIHEVVARRFQRLYDEQEKFPDILLIDGGKGQLSAALSAFEERQIEPPTVISLAKRDEEIFLPNQSEPLRLSRHAYALRLLQYVRDEAHRFAIMGHRNRRDKKRKQSVLEDIPGVGPKRRRELLNHFGGLQGLTKASRHEIEKVPGISNKIA